MAAVPLRLPSHSRSASLASTSAAHFAGSQLRIPSRSARSDGQCFRECRAHRGVYCMAKGGKKGGNKKGGSSIPKPGNAGGGDASSPPSVPATPYTSGEIIMHSLDIIDSYFRAVGSTIFREPVEVVHAAKALWDADFVVITHGTEEDPIFNYGNAKALELFETTWPEFTAMPSRKSCPEETQSTRTSLLESASTTAKDLKGIVRQTTTGRLFEVDEGVVWTLVASDGENFGQAAVFRGWHFLDEKEGDEPKEEGAQANGGTGSQEGGAPSNGSTPLPTPEAASSSV